MRSLRWWWHRQQLRRMKLLVLDVDGVLTDGGLWYDPNGQLTKRFDVRDGLCDERLRADNTIYYVARVSRNARASAFSEPWNTPTITVVKTRSTQFYRVNSSCASSIPAAAASPMHPHGPWECIEPLRSRLGGRGRD